MKKKTHKISRSRNIFLIAFLLNAFGWLVYAVVCMVDEYFFGRFALLLTSLCVVFATSFGMFIGHMLLRKKNYKPIIRLMIYGAPSFIVLVIGFFLPAEQQIPNQMQNIFCPSGKYYVSVPIEKNFWRVTIHDIADNIEYRDDESDFSGVHYVYWLWDKEDNLWLYNSDDSKIFLWRRVGVEWEKLFWGYWSEKKLKTDLDPPCELFPDYSDLGVSMRGDRGRCESAKEIGTD